LEYHLAPLKNVSCWAFRAVCTGATDSYTEMMNISQLLNLNSVKWKVVDAFQIPNQKQWIQVLAHNPSDFEKLPIQLQKFSSLHPKRNNIFGININAGCPEKHVIAAKEGAALISQPQKLITMVKTFLGKPESHSYAISIKMRLGIIVDDLFTNNVQKFLELLAKLEDPRIKPTIIHFKLASQKSSEKPMWDMLEGVLDTHTPIIINGNIRNKQDIQRIKNNLPQRYFQDWKTNIKGVMIGREAIKYPDCFLNFYPKNKFTNTIEWRTRLEKNLENHLPLDRFKGFFRNQYCIKL
jgi:tRNA-dihydrouridine synthase